MEINAYVDRFELSGDEVIYVGWIYCVDLKQIYGVDCFNYSVAYDKVQQNITIEYIRRPDITGLIQSLYGLTTNSLDDFFGFSIRLDRVDDLNLLEFRASIFDKVTYPIVNQKNIQLEISGDCNLKCIMCPQFFGIKNENMTVKELDKFYNEFRYYSHFELNYQGELLLSPNFPQVLSNISRNKYVFFSTNGHLLTTKTIDTIIDNTPPIRFLRISLDSTQENLYRKIRGANLGPLHAKISRLICRNQQLGLNRMKISLGAIVMRENMTSVHELITYSQKVGADLVEFWPLANESLHGGDGWNCEREGWTFTYINQILSEEEWLAFVSKAKQLATNLGVHVLFPDIMIANGKPKNTISRCPHIQNSASFEGSGNAKSCCHQTSSIYNWKEAGVDFFSHSRTQEIAELAKRNIIPRECAGARCSYVMGLPASEKSCLGFHPGTGIWLQRGAI